LDRIEQAGLAFFERARQSYISHVNALDNAVSIDASQSMEKVQQDALAALSQFLQERL
jgi:dTMP kinase